MAAALAIGLLLPLGALHGWAGVPADSKEAERTMELLRAQVESHVTSLRGERPARIDLTLDLAAQSLIEQELEVIQQQFHPQSASIVALDPRSGAVLGLGSRGGGDRNLAVEQTYEPASTLKVFSIAAALDAGTIRPEQSFTTESGSVNSSGQAVRDATPAASLTVADILARSSNIGSIKIYRTLGKEGLVTALHRFHFGESPNLRIPAAAGTVAQSDWTDAQVEGAAFGQGMVASPLQLAAAFAAGGFATGLAEVDRQRSSLSWLKLRASHHRPIQGLDWRRDIGEVPDTIRRLVIDAPANLRMRHVDDLIREAYRGIRPAPGYPACPDHTVKGELFKLLDAPARADMHLTESFAMSPAAAVSGFYFAHPDAHYFAVSKIGRDQLEDWAKRKGMSIKDAEYWLAPLL